MPNIASALKEEIARVTRKVAKPESDGLRKQLAQHRSALAALKRRIDALERALANVAKGGRGIARQASEAASDETQSERLRFSAKGFAAQRQRLGLSAAAMGQLLGVSSLSVYKWESGKTRPRAKQIEKIASIRGLGKKEAAERLEGGGATPARIFEDAGKATTAGSAEQVKRGGRKAAKPSATNSAVKKAAGKKSAAKKAAAKKTTPKKATAKKATASRAPEAAKKAAGKKTPKQRGAKQAAA
jgi:transcriptional regulator with XRE-family HTH domain/BMFP domain-containing protein YqiC